VNKEMATTVTIYRLCVDGDMENSPVDGTSWESQRANRINKQHQGPHSRNFL